MDKKVLTLTIEMNSADDCRWIWASHKAYLLYQAGLTHGITVVDMDEGEHIQSHNELKKEHYTLQHKNEKLQIKLDEALNKFIELQLENKRLKDNKE